MLSFMRAGKQKAKRKILPASGNIVQAREIPVTWACPSPLFHLFFFFPVCFHSGRGQPLWTDGLDILHVVKLLHNLVPCSSTKGKMLKFQNNY